MRVANQADGGFFYWLAKLYGFASAVLLVLAAIAAIAVYGYFARAAPATPDLNAYAAMTPGVSRMVAADGTLLGEFAEEWREIVPYDQIPPKLIEAFLAAEDHEFFSHGGLYLKGIARALWRNVTAGEWQQGGSTITQQVAKQFLGSEKTLDRKAREAIVARRLEARYSKQEILAVYMNHIFLGSGAYGVKAAAKRYFSKDLDRLDVGEMAMIAGLAQAPSRDSPLVNPENAKRRRDSVLDKMGRYGYLSNADAEAWQAKPIATRPYRDVFLSTSPYFAEDVRRNVLKRYGAERLGKRGLHIETTIEPWVDGVAYENVDFDARRQDYRQGWRGPEAHLEGKPAIETFLERQRARYGGGSLVESRRYLALVENVRSSGATVRIGDARYDLPLRNMKWAHKWSRTDSMNDLTITSATEALRAGDVVWVSRPPSRLRPFQEWSYDDHLNAHWLPAREQNVKPNEVRLDQTPRVQAAIYSFDHQTGYVNAMVGGQDYARSEFNRATQACRQPGSTYKPIYYSAALDEGYGFDSTLNDVPKAEVDPVTGEVWIPVNLHGTVDFSVSLEYALVFSKNIPSVDIFSKVGARNVAEWARRLGFTTEIIADKALALGASCTRIDELSRAFAIFARNGRWIDPITVRRVTDATGAVLEDNTVWYDPVNAPRDRFDRLAATAGLAPKQAIPARAAFLTTKLLRSVVTDGFSGSLRAIGVPAAGKTGTSSFTADVWFVGFTSRWLATMWIGDDLRERPLGKNDAAFMSALPMWARFMAEATTGQPLREIPWEVPAGVKPNDRGGSKGRSLEGHMPLVPHKKEKVEEAPPGLKIGAPRERPTG